MTGEHTVHIAIYYSGGQTKGNTSDGSSGIIANTFQLFYLFKCIWKMTKRHNLLGSMMQVTGPAIVSQPLPLAQHLILRSGSQILNLWPTTHEALPVVPALFHLCLLQNNLREPDGVWITCLPPRQITAVLMEPPQQYKRELTIHLFTSLFYSFP